MRTRDDWIEQSNSQLTDATCDLFRSFDRIPLRSSLHVSLLFRYLAQHQMIYAAKDRDRPVRVLDVGCANGAALRLYASHQAQAPGRRKVDYLGLDLYGPALEEAMANVPKVACVHSCAYLQLDITEPWSIPTEAFDVIWITEVIEHVPLERARFVLTECALHAHGETRMLLSTPDRTHAPRGQELVWPSSHDHEFTYAEMNDLLLTTGWNPLEVWGTNANWKERRSYLRKEEPQWFDFYEMLRTRLSPPVAAAVVQALRPDLSDDIAYLCERQ